MPAPARDFDDVVGYRNTDAGQVPVTLMERVIETIRAGAFMHDAAARIGTNVETLRAWRRLGQSALQDVVNGRRRMSELSRHERQCATLATRMEEAEAEAKVMLTGTMMKMAAGGWTRQERSTRTTSGGQTETTLRVIEVGPDSHALSWMLSHRWRDDFGSDRLEVTGRNGGPIQVDAAPIADKLRDAIATARANRDGTHVPAGQAAANGNGHTANGNGSTTP